MVHLRFAAITTALILMSACSSTGTRVATNSGGEAAAATKPACLDTASRIKRQDGNCIGFGRSYSTDEMRAFGATTTADGLRTLVPGVTVSH